MDDFSHCCRSCFSLSIRIWGYNHWHNSSERDLRIILRFWNNPTEQFSNTDKNWQELTDIKRWLNQESQSAFNISRRRVSEFSLAAGASCGVFGAQLEELNTKQDWESWQKETANTFTEALQLSTGRRSEDFQVKELKKSQSQQIGGSGLSTPAPSHSDDRNWRHLGSGRLSHARGEYNSVLRDNVRS